MPQRKDYDVYAGNQKVGEIWSNHQDKSDYESHLNVIELGVQMDRHKRGAFSKSFYAKEKKMKRNGIIRAIVGVGAIIAAIFVIVKIERNGWQDCILPSALLGVGLALVKSGPITSYKKEDVYIDKEEIAKGFFWGVGLFVVLVAWCYIGSFAKDFFGIR